MKGVRGLNHKYWLILHLIPTISTLRSQQSTYQGMAASLWPLVTVEGAELHYICITKTWYEYEVGGGLNHKTCCDLKFVLYLQGYLLLAEQHSGVTSLWQPITVEDAKTILIYSVEVQSAKQSFPTLTMTYQSDRCCHGAK